MKSFRRIFGIATMYKGRLILSQILLFISVVCTVSFASLTSGLINQGMVAGDVDAVFDIGWWMFILAVLSGLCMAGAATIAVFFSQGMSYTIRSMFYEKLQTFSFANYDKVPTGELMVRLNADALNVQNGVLYAVMMGLLAPFQLLVSLVLVYLFTPELLWLMFAVITIIVILIFLIVPAIFRNYEERQSRLDAVNNKLQENITGIQVVKAFVREDYEIEQFNQRADEMREPAYGAAFRVAFLSPLLTGVAQLAIIATLAVGGMQVLEGTGINVGQLVTFTQYLTLAIAPLAIMGIVIPMVLRADTSAERILEVYDDVAEIEDRADAKPLAADDVKGRIEFENVTFAFHNKDGELEPPVLKNIDLVIEPGSQVGFLGATGAGKTALVNLIPRFYDVTEGRIIIDGVDVRDIPQDNLRKIVGIALQEAMLFQGDVRFNMKFAQPQAEDDVMFDAAKAADSWGFVNNLPEKWEAPVSRRGYNFSGGQRQRLSINRVLTQEPKILILDDSTSALDASTEGRVQDAIPVFTNGSTTLYVAQRISAVIELDNIVLLEHGEIVAMGNHEELLESSSLYQEIYESQLGGAATAGLELEVA